MSDWKIGLSPATSERMPTILGPLTAHIAWKRLSKQGRAAIADATTKNILVYAHPLTIKALERHGFVIGTAYSSRTAVLTDAGRAVAKWMVR